MSGLLLALAGGLGAGLRFCVDGALTRLLPSRVPLATLLINVTGAFLLGLLVGGAAGSVSDDGVVAVLGTGLLGGWTTFSAASVESARLAAAGRRRDAVLHAGGMLALAVVAAAAGAALGDLLA